MQSRTHHVAQAALEAQSLLPSASRVLIIVSSHYVCCINPTFSLINLLLSSAGDRIQGFAGVVMLSQATSPSLGK